MKKIIILLLTIVVLIITSTAQAEIETNLAVGNPKALAMGNAVTADPPGIDSIHFNPAGLAKIKGKSYQVKVLAGAFSTTAKFGDQAQAVKDQLAIFPTTQGRDNGAFTDKIIGTTSKTGGPVVMLPGAGLTKMPALILPSAGFAINPPDTNITFADAIYSPDGAGYSRDKDDPGRYQGEEVSLVTLTYLSPSVGFELIKDVYVGASVGISWQGVGLDLDLRAPNFLTYGATQVADATLSDQTCLKATNFLVEGLCGSLGPYDDLFHLNIQATNAVVPSVNLGALWDATPYLSFGAVYQSASRSELEGPYKFDYTKRWQNFFSKLSPFTAPLGFSVGKEVDKGNVKLEYTEPQRFAMGTSIKLIPRLKVNVDLKWVDYSVWKTLDLKFDQNIDFLKFAAVVQPANATADTLSMPRGYRSVWAWAFGGEYQLNNQIALRAGYEPRKSAIPADKTDLLLPIADANLYTVGFGFQLTDDQLIEGAFAYFTSKYTIKNGVGEQSSNFNMYDDNIHNAIYNPYAGLSANVDTHAYLFSLAYTNKF